MELKTGGVYLIKRKPLKTVDLFEYTNGHYKKLYNLTMTCKVLLLQAGNECTKEINLVCFLSGGGKEAYGLDTVDYLHTQWLERIELKKILRDMRDWPESARRHFLMMKGAGSSAALEGDLEEARRSIARNDRTNRLYNERKEQEKKKKASWKDAHTTAGSFCIESSGNTGGASYYAPAEATVRVKPVKVDGEWVEAPDMPEEVYKADYDVDYGPVDPLVDDEVLELITEKPKKKRKKKKWKGEKYVPKKMDMHGKVYTAPPVTATHHSEPVGAISGETLAKIKKELDGQAKKDKEKMLANLYNSPGYGEFKKNKGHVKLSDEKPKKKHKPPLADAVKKDMTFKQWAMEAEAKVKADKEEAE